MSSIFIKKKFSVFLFLHRLSNFVIFLRLVIIEYAKEITNKRQKKTEGAIKNGQYRETGNIWVHVTQDEDKQNNNK